MKPYFRVLVVDKFDGVVNYEVPDKFAGVADVLGGIESVSMWCYPYVMNEGEEYFEIELVQEFEGSIYVLAVLDRTFRIMEGPTIVPKVLDES